MYFYAFLFSFICNRLVDQFTREKEHALNAVTKQKEAEKRALMLVNHTEKLMKCLKMEAAAKMHVLETNRKERKYVDNEEFMVCLCVGIQNLKRGSPRDSYKTLIYRQ